MPSRKSIPTSSLATLEAVARGDPIGDRRRLAWLRREKLVTISEPPKLTAKGEKMLAQELKSREEAARAAG